MNAPARTAAFLTRSAPRGTEQDRAVTPSSPPCVDGSGASAGRRLTLATAFALTLTLAFGAVSALADTLPTITGEQAKHVGVTTAVLTAEVNGNSAPGDGDTTYRVQWSLSGTDHGGDGNENWNLGFEGGIAAGCECTVDATALLGYSGELSPGETYEFRLVAENGAGSDQTAAPYPTFTMDEVAVPTLAAKKTTPVGYTAATLNATVNPQGGNVNPIGGAIPINWQLEYREVGQESWNYAAGGEIAGGLPVEVEPGVFEDPPAQSTKALAIAAELPPTTLQAGRTYEVQVQAFYLNYAAQTVSPPIPVVTFTTKAATAPTLSVEDATTITGASAHVGGTANANAPILSSPTPEEEADVHAAFDSYCYFDYVTEATYKEAGNAFPNEPPAVGCEPTNPVSGTSPTAASAELGGLEPHTKYRLRLRAENQGGKSYLQATPFITEAVAPTIASTFVESVGDDGATLNAKIIPGGAPTTYHFRVEGGSAGVISTPETPLGAEDNAEHIASAPIGGLQPDTTYVYRVIATNSKGTIEGDVHQLHTFALPREAPDTCPNAARRSEQQSAFLPDCRAYEMVSPPDKHGGDVAAMTERTRVATDGNAASFASLVPFGDAIGSGVAIEYISLRDGAPATNGWSTHAITPPQEALAVNEITFDPLFVGDLSDDLSRGVLRSLSPLTGDPNVAEVPNLYARDDLRSAGAGAYQLLTPCPLCDLPGGTPLPTPVNNALQPFYGGASDDFSHILYQAKVNLTSDAPAQLAACATNTGKCKPRAYEWAGGQLHLIGLVPSGSEATCGGAGPPCVVAEASVVGADLGPSIAPNRPLNVISADGSRAFFSVPTNGSVYMREGAISVQINASERTDCAGDPSCGGDDVPDPQPDEFSPATYLTASADGSRVLFLSIEALTDDAPGDDAGKLYMYDATKPPSDLHNLTLLKNGAAGLVAASEDGSYVYFNGGGTGGSVSPDIYVWHNGVVNHVGSVDTFFLPEVLSTGANYNGTITEARISADGRHLLFSSHSTGPRELYLYSADTQDLVCVSCPTDGTTPSGDAATALRENKSVAAITWHLNRALSSDGNVFFTSPDPLVPEDTNGRKDAYEYDAQTSQLHLLSSGTDSSDSYFLEADPDGSNALFATREQLVGWDNDGAYDLYDARVDGGFPEPKAVKAPCSGDSCPDAAPPAPGPAPVSSITFTGPGNQPGKFPRCPKGKHAVKRHGKTRCVKNKRRARTRANTNRRAGR